MDESRINSPNSISATNSRLLSDARDDQEAAWQVLVHVYAPVVRYWIKRKGVRERADAADIVQEVFVAVARGLREFRREAGQAKFRSWLKTVTQNKVTDFFRRVGRTPPAAGGSIAAAQLNEVAEAQVPEDEEEAPEALEESLITRGMLSLIQDEFRPNTWQAFWRTAVDGVDATQVGEELGINSAAVRKAKSRVLRRLREALADLHGG